MNLTIAKEKLLHGLQAVQNVVSTRTTLPILSNVLMKAEGNKMEFTATDLDVTINCTVEATVKKKGATTIPVKRFFGVVRELGSPEIELEVDEKHACSIRAGASFYKINGLSADEFPPIPKFKEDKKIILAQEKMKSMLRKTSFAISTDESRYVLNGIFIILKEHKMTMVATDGRRLALVDEEVDIPENSQGEFILPTKAVNEITRLLGDKGDVEMKFSENQVSLSLADEKGNTAVVISKLVEGNYPNYKQVIPSDTKERVALPREEMLAALRRAQIMTSDKANSVKLAIGRNNLAITANSP
ncbi:MAG TPA: DNA polymerase III subunit beta, partial [Candidatus Acidoferrum sp.]|nr:DNA polymerase III subunit beta [Candidatus Acidoferrum sp.]